MRSVIPHPFPLLSIELLQFPFNLLNLVIVDRSVVLKSFILNILSISNMQQSTSLFLFRASAVYFAYFTQCGELGLTVVKYNY